MIFRKNFKKRGGQFRSEKFHCKFGASATGLQKKIAIYFWKKGRWEMGGSKAVQKFSKNSSISEKKKKAYPSALSVCCNITSNKFLQMASTAVL